LFSDNSSRFDVGRNRFEHRPESLSGSSHFLQAFQRGHSRFVWSLSHSSSTNRRQFYEQLIINLLHGAQSFLRSWQSVSQSVSQEIPRLYGSRRFIIVFTRARHWSLCWVRWIQSTASHPISL